MDPKHIFWPIFEDYIVGNVGAILNQTTGYDGSENNIEPLTHVVQPAGVSNIDPMVAIGEKEEAKRIIDALPKEHPFEVRYTKVEKVDWESCATVLSAEEKRRVLEKGWGQ